MDEQLAPIEDENVAEPIDPTVFLMSVAQMQGNISDLLDATTIAAIEQQVCEQYDRDLLSRDGWEKVARRALEDMTKAEHEAKTSPWANASNVHYPLLAQAVMQFNARSYPAIVKGDEAVSVKVVGSDNGRQAMSPMGPVFQVQGAPVVMSPQGPVVVTPQGPQPLPQGVQPEPMWERAPGAKAKRAGRVQDYMNTVLFYRMDDWETETDTLLLQLPAIGCAFRKTWFNGKHQSRFVPALNLVVDNNATSLQDAPQIAERIDGVFPHHIRRDIALGKYRSIELDPEDTESRSLLEVQCYYDLDGDGIDEPYIVTIEQKEKQLLRIVPDFGPEHVSVSPEGKIGFIERPAYYTKYEFMPDPEGKFYNPGLAHLLHQHGEVINTIINQMLDASHAAVAGGGFVASGLRIQGQGQSSTLRMRPGEYKTVSVNGQELRAGFVERTTPQLSPVQFSLLELILGAAREIASIKDVLSGDAANTGQVGTTLALIEQGLQSFTAIYKRVYRGLKHEFTLLFGNIGKYADQSAAQDYVELLDDPEADFAKDFNVADMDIRPVSDPSSVTKMQKMARAQFLLQTMPQLQAAGGDIREVMRRVYEAGDVEDIEKLLPEQKPSPMAEMMMQLEVADKQATVEQKQSQAAKNTIEAQVKATEAGVKQGELQVKAGDLNLRGVELGFEMANPGLNIAAS